MGNRAHSQGLAGTSSRLCPHRRAPCRSCDSMPCPCAPLRRCRCRNGLGRCGAAGLGLLGRHQFVLVVAMHLVHLDTVAMMRGDLLVSLRPFFFVDRIMLGPVTAMHGSAFVAVAHQHFGMGPLRTGHLADTLAVAARCRPLRLGAGLAPLLAVLMVVHRFPAALAFGLFLSLSHVVSSLRCGGARHRARKLWIIRKRYERGVQLKKRPQTGPTPETPPE